MLASASVQAIGIQLDGSALHAMALEYLSACRMQSWPVLLQAALN
jgi:hypothetical protein